MIPWSITETERGLAEKCLAFFKEAGASDARITLGKSITDLFAIRNGELDKVSRSADRSMTFNIFANGRFGAFSSNRLEEEELRKFIGKAVKSVNMLAPDGFRKLPPASRTAKDAVTGLEMGLYDPEYASMDADRRLGIALKSSFYHEAAAKAEGYEVVSEELEYSDSLYDSYIVDTNGLRCRHTETSFEIGAEVSVRNGKGERFSGYWWDAQPRFADLDTATCARKALERAVAQLNPKKHKGGKFTMVVDNETASKLLAPVLSALGGYQIQQNNSFLADTQGKQIFPEGFTVMDLPRQKGRIGARMFDSEGVATYDRPIIEDGKVCGYFLNTHIAGKLGMEPTLEDGIRPTVLPFLSSGVQENSNAWASESGPRAAEARLDRDGIMEICGDGILVTGFNGGNSNSATGDFSYGIEGFAFREGKIIHPVRGMVITGNLLSLWNNLIAAGTDPRDGKSRQVPTLAFRDVDFSA